MSTLTKAFRNTTRRAGSAIISAWSWVPFSAHDLSISLIHTVSNPPGGIYGVRNDTHSASGFHDSFAHFITFGVYMACTGFQVVNVCFFCVSKSFDTTPGTASCGYQRGLRVFFFSSIRRRLHESRSLHCSWDLGIFLFFSIKDTSSGSRQGS